MVRVFHLYPIDAIDPAWSRTKYRDLCLVVEVNEGAARLLAARTFAVEGVQLSASPWLDSSLSHCLEAPGLGERSLEAGLILWDGRRSE